MTDDDDEIPMTGFVALDDPNRIVTQTELDWAKNFTGPVLNIMQKIPVELRASVITSVVVTFCLNFEDPDEALKALCETFHKMLPHLQAARRSLQ